MDTQLIIILIGIALIAIITIPLSRKAKLGKVKPLDGEKTLFEEEDIKTYFEMKNGHFLPSATLAKLDRTTQIRSVVRVTNKRIIIAQKPLVTKEKDNAQIRQMIYFNTEAKPAKVSDFMGGFLLKGGYMSFYLDALKAEVVKKKKTEVISIELPTEKRTLVAGLGKLHVEIHSKKTKELNDILQKV